jgi:phosphatidylinositol-3-phosphatase
VPAAFARWLSILRPDAGSEAVTGGATPGAEEGAAAVAAVEASAAEDTTLAERFMPEPRSAAIATMALLAFGVVVGAATGPLAQSAGISPIVVEMGSTPSTASSAEPEGEAAEPIAEAPVESPQGTTSSVLNEPGPGVPQDGGGEEEPPEEIEEETLPPIQHVFMIVLGDHGYEESFGASSQSTYLSQALPAKGELLSNYFAVTQGDLANEVALLSGQGPTAATAANCPEYKDVSPGTLNAEGQAEGDGCAYPAEVKTLPGQLAEAKKSWKAYVEGIGSGQAGQPTSCRHPALGGPDDAQAPRPGDPYQTWRNPFVYFHSLVDSADCGERDVGLEQLEADLKVEKQTPALSYIVPDACHDGSEVPCEPGQPAGLAATQPFLEKVVPEIEASAAYKKGGLIAITFAQAPQSGPNADASACCGTPEYPNLPPPPTVPASTGPVKAAGGGGRVGTLLLSPFVEPGSVNETYYNHFSMLLSIEEFFGLPSIGYAASGGVLPFEGSVFNLSS